MNDLICVIAFILLDDWLTSVLYNTKVTFLVHEAVSPLKTLKKIRSTRIRSLQSLRRGLAIWDHVRSKGVVSREIVSHSSKRSILLFYSQNFAIIGNSTIILETCSGLLNCVQRELIDFSDAGSFVQLIILDLS